MNAKKDTVYNSINSCGDERLITIINTSYPENIFYYPFLFLLPNIVIIVCTCYFTTKSTFLKVLILIKLMICVNVRS